jgi:ornithine--oxo-acid transaminase
MATSTVSVSGYMSYQSHVNPQWVNLLNVLEMNEDYVHCEGAELFTRDGRRILDFLSGYCVHNTGHNHPAIVQALKDELDARGPAMLQSHVPHLAGELAAQLTARAGGRLEKVYFCSSGSEGVESAIKFARAHTRRSLLVYAEHAFHGLTCGALSLMSDRFWREGFGPLLPDTAEVAFNDLTALEKRLSGRQAAAFIVEPIQSEGGIVSPEGGYLRSAQDLCRKFGTLLVLDEVQTGMYRTGPFLAAHHYGVEPDMVVLAKALSGGLVPSAAVLLSDAIYRSVFGSLKRAIVHASTFGENGLSMRAGLATLEVLDNEVLGARATESGEYLRRRLTEELSSYDMVKSVRGCGLLNGIEFGPPRQLAGKLAFEALQALHPAAFGQLIVMRLFREHGILTQICGNNFLVVKATPPLAIREQQMEAFVFAIRQVVHLAQSSSAFWTKGLRLARRALGSLVV